MKSKFPVLLGLSAVLLATACSTATETTDKSSTSAEPASESSQSAPSASSSSSPSPTSSAGSVTAQDIIPTLAQAQSDEDKAPAEFNEPSIKASSLRALAPLSYAQEFAAVNDEDELCLIAWANSGDGDGTATLNGPEVECEDPSEVKDEGLKLSIDSAKDKPGVVLAMLPPDITEDAARTELLKIPGNHEDLRPPVEFKATDFGVVSIAMEPATAEELGSITFPRKDGTKFTLDLD